MKDVLLDEKLFDNALKALFVRAEKSFGPVENCEHKTSRTFVEEVDEGTPKAKGLNLLPRFVETVATVVRRCVSIEKDFAQEVADFAKCACCKFRFAGGADVRLVRGNGDGDKVSEG